MKLNKSGLFFLVSLITTAEVASAADNKPFVCHDPLTFAMVMHKDDSGTPVTILSMEGSVTENDPALKLVKFVRKRTVKINSLGFKTFYATAQVMDENLSMPARGKGWTKKDVDGAAAAYNELITHELVCVECK